MIKSKFVTKDDIIQEKPKQFKKFNPDYERLYIKIFDVLFFIKLDAVKEFFLNDDKTLITCNLDKKTITGQAYEFLVTEYYFNNNRKPVEMSADYSTTGKLIESAKSNNFEILFNDDESLILNMLVSNSELK